MTVKGEILASRALTSPEGYPLIFLGLLTVASMRLASPRSPSSVEARDEPVLLTPLVALR